jgi:hydrogenase expression/formation protein HypC
MCLVKPVQVSRVEGEIAWISEEDRERRISLLGVEDVAPGDYVLVHAGIALARLQPDEAREILRALDSVAALDAGDEVSG